MKHLYYLIILIFLAGCAGRPAAERSRVRLEFRDSVSHEYYLIAVRDSGLIVLPGYYDLKGPAQFISSSKINHVYYYSNGKTTGMWIGGLTGFGVVLATSLVYLAVRHPDIGGGEGFGIGVSFISLPAIVIGMITGYLVSNDEDVFDISKAHDRDVLREVAIFPDKEPPELQNIK
jgi:hypothetical protein